MKQYAKVIKTEGQTAQIIVKRSTMCDGCSKKGCGGTCSAGSVFGAKKEMTAKACNRAGAVKGDIVEIETKTSVVMKYALMIFIMPIIVSAILYFIGKLLFHEENTAIFTAGIGFILSFIFIGFVEKTKSKRSPDVVIKRVVNINEYNRMEVNNNVL